MTRLFLVCGAVALITMLELGAHSIAYADAWGPQDAPTIFNAELNLSGGMPAPDGQYTVTFSLWDQQNAGMMLWTETKIVQVAGGVFTTSLGTQTPIGIDVLTGTNPGDTRWLEVQLQGDTPMPRFQLHTVPYAGVAGRLRGDISTADGVLYVEGDTGTHEVGHYAGFFFNEASDTLAAYGNQGGFVRDSSGRGLVAYGGHGRYGGGPDFDTKTPNYFVTNGSGDSIAALGPGEAIFVGNDSNIRTKLGFNGLSIGSLQSASPSFTITANGNPLNLPTTTVSFLSADGNYDTLMQLGGQELGDAFIKMTNPATGDVATYSWDGTSMATPFVSGIASSFRDSRATTYSEASTGDTLASYGNEGGFVVDPANDVTIAWGSATSELNLPASLLNDRPPLVLRGAIADIGGVCVADPIFLNYTHQTANGILAQAGTLIHELGYGNGLASYDVGSGDTTVSLSGSGFAFGALSRAHGLRSFAGGHRAKAEHGGSFVWADGANNDLSTSGIDQVLMRASGGYTLFTNGSKTAGVALAPGGNQWDMISDSASKTNVRAIDGNELLAKIAELPISRWSYKSEGEAIEHIGPMAQDFYEAFGLGRGETTISSLDPSGVALAAIKALYESQKAENDELRKQIAELRELLEGQSK